MPSMMSLARAALSTSKRARSAPKMRSALSVLLAQSGGKTRVAALISRRFSSAARVRKRGPSTYGSRSLSGLQQQFSDDLAAFEQRLGAAGFGERQAVVDQRADAAGGEVVQQRGHRRGTDVGPVVEAMDREEAHRRALGRIGPHRGQEIGVGRAV